VSTSQEARIPIVLIDRCFLPYPKRSHHDLVSIDNRRAGYMVTERLLKLGCQRIAFLAHAYSASTVEARIAGYREALFVAGSPFEATLVQRLNSNHASEVGRVIEMLKPDAIVCANDRTAGHVMQSLIGVNCRIPEDVRIVGIDDVEYASLLPVPLTTVHQPCLEIGAGCVAFKWVKNRVKDARLKRFSGYPAGILANMLTQQESRITNLQSMAKASMR